MNKYEAKELVDSELKKARYALEHENDIYNIKSYAMSLAGFGLCGGMIAGAVPTLTPAGIIAIGAGVVVVSVATVKLIEYSHHNSEETKLELKRDHFGKKVLLDYKKHLKKGTNPFADIPYDRESFELKLNNDIDKRVYKKVKQKVNK